MILTVHIIGTPAPQGSKRHVGHGVLVESAAGVRDWRMAVALQVASKRNSQALPAFTGPLRVDIRFLIHRPVKPRHPLPDTRPDLDKLVRATMDGITDSAAWNDDAQVTTLHVTKRYAPNGTALGAWLTITDGDH